MALAITVWHLRRRFDTALAEAGVNAQHTMHLSGHADPKVHQRYVMATEAMRAVPTAALPPIEVLPRVNDWRKRPRMPKGKPASFLERDTGFEPATSSLGSWHSTN